MKQMIGHKTVTSSQSIELVLFPLRRLILTTNVNNRSRTQCSLPSCIFVSTHEVDVESDDTNGLMIILDERMNVVD